MSPNEFETGEEVHAFFRRLEDRLRENPAVMGASLTVGNPPKPAIVNRDYFKLMGIRLLGGRFFDSSDTLNSKPVIVIDELLAKARFPGENPIGKSFVIDMPEARATGLGEPREVIGVVNHVKRFGIETDDQIVLQAQFYISTEQVKDAGFEGAPGGLRMFIKSTWPDRELFQQISQITHHVDPRKFNGDITVAGVMSLENNINQALAPRFFVTRQLGAFAAIAFIMAAIGIYGVIAYSVSQRTQELGVRMALGAETRHIASLVMKAGGLMASAGIALGLVSSFWLGKFIQFLLFDVTSTDPATYAAAVVLLLGTAIIASCIPAHRAIRLGPMNALRGAGSDAAAASTRRFFASAEEKPAVIEVRDLQKTFPGIRNKSVAALGGVSLQVEPGTIFGLIGQNGAGKTTLVKILLSLCRPTSGTARLLGCLPGNPIAQRRIGYLPESMRIPDHFMAEDFLTYMGKLNGVPAATLKQRIPQLLESVGLAGADKPVRNYSKGMQQRLGLAQALINDPELLFLDEPTDGLDPLGRIDVRDLLLRLRAEGKTIFLNSHLLSEIELVCDRIVILDKGKVACTTTPAEFTRGTGEYLVRLAEGGTLRFTPRDLEQLNELLDGLRRSGATILAVEPLRLSLEQFFIEVVSERKS
jgi:ABC-2 type transport system ATP-binding protein